MCEKCLYAEKRVRAGKWERVGKNWEKRAEMVFCAVNG